VSLQIGVNDQYRGRPPAEYCDRFEALLARAIEFAGGRAEHVLVLSIPDWGTTPFARSSGRDREHIAEQIDRYNAIAAAACRSRQVRWVDITGVTRDPATAGLLAEDGLHPSGDMYACWVRCVEATS
jgi:lysophospholipase L1-like esterase